jgi:hypothetical protein
VLGALGPMVAVLSVRTEVLRRTSVPISWNTREQVRGACAAVAGEHWKDKPEAEDFPAAESYLSLLVGAGTAAKLVKVLRKQRSLKHYAAKDILRAAGLPMLGPDDSEVVADLKKVKAGDRLSPVLLVQGVPLWVADGYHRICASYYLDEKTEVPCRIVDRTP